MPIRCITDLEKSALKGKRVLIRADFNVPMDDAGNITDDSRIKANLKTLCFLLDNEAKIIITSHMGRPKGQAVDKLRLTPIAHRLAQLLNWPVQKLDTCIGQAATTASQALNDKDILLLENTRFHKEETENDATFAKELASLADIFVHDAFGVAHRAHASSHGVAQYLPSYAGCLLEKEISILSNTLNTPKTPVLSIIGGAKISSKLGVLENLLDKVDTIVIGGGMSFTLLKAQGFEIGKSLCEDDLIDTAKAFLEKAKNSKTKIVLPSDQVLVESFDNDAPQHIANSENIGPNHMGVDIGPESISEIKNLINTANTVIWNGPLGVFELSNFAKGTMEIAETLANATAYTIIGGGDSGAAIKKAGVEEKINHISTGGGATLEFLEGKTLPGIAILEGSNEKNTVCQ